MHTLEYFFSSCEFVLSLVVRWTFMFKFSLCKLTTLVGKLSKRLAIFFRCHLKRPDTHDHESWLSNQNQFPGLCVWSSGLFPATNKLSCFPCIKLFNPPSANFFLLKWVVVKKSIFISTSLASVTLTSKKFKQQKVFLFLVEMNEHGKNSFFRN